MERHTRYLLLVHLPERRDATTARNALSHTMIGLPEDLRKPFTWDQDTELAEHKQFQVETGIPVFSCNTASPWRRGSNQNTNGLLKQHFPKGTDLSVHSAEEPAQGCVRAQHPSPEDARLGHPGETSCRAHPRLARRSACPQLQPLLI